MALGAAASHAGGRAFRVRGLVSTPHHRRSDAIANHHDALS
jgi:hypothetical protein